MENYSPKPPLNFRVDLCYKLAAAVLQAQLLGLARKNTRSENILIHPLEAVQSPTAKPEENIPALGLCGWQYDREEEQGVALLTGSNRRRHVLAQDLLASRTLVPNGRSRVLDDTRLLQLGPLYAGDTLPVECSAAHTSIRLSRIRRDVYAS